MSRRRKDPSRTLSADERSELTRLSRSRHASAAQVARATALLAGAAGGGYPTAAAAQVARATALLAVADGRSYLTAARRAGRRDGDTVAAWVARFNREGLAAGGAAPGGGAPRRFPQPQGRRPPPPAR